MRVEINREEKLIQGHVLDVARGPLAEALRRYDPQLYLKWSYNKKRSGKGYWELRRRPELKSVKVGRVLDTPRGMVFFPGDVYEFQDFTLAVPKYHETSADCIKKFEYLDYSIVDWVAKSDLWRFGYKGKNFTHEAEYLTAKYEEKIDEESYAEKAYGLKQMKTQINDFRQYILDGGDPYRLLDFWK